VDHMLDVNFDKTTSLTLPFAYEVVSKEISDTKFIAFRELEVTDIAALVYFIDSIVATKASPKIKYVRVLNPAYPTFSTSTHDALKFTFDRSPFNPNLPCASVAFIGNVNSGKSSIGGHLLELLNVVPQNVVHRLGEEAKKIGYSEDIKHAWVLDRTKDARTKGRTLDSTYVGFQTPTRRFTTIDNPGHKDYSKNSTIGIFHADIVVLVTSVVMSEIELAEISRSQAEEHLVTSFCFGVRQIIVAINKMDLVNYSQSCFETVKKHMLKHILKAGFKANQVTYVPVSGTNGDCLLSDSANMPWYSGASLLQAMDEAPLPPRHVEKQFRLVVEETRNIKGIGHVVCGRVERGKITTGDIFKLYPNGPEGRVVSIESHHRQTDTGFPGDDIGISFRNVGGKSKSNQESPIVRGMIAGLTCNPPVAVMQRFEAQILLLRGAPIKVGYAPTLTMHLNLIQVTFVRLIEVIDRNNTSIEKNPESASVGQTFICELECIRPVAAETIHDAPRLSRFMIKEMRVIRALGFIRAKLA
jgi:elongation factor 1-alpha